MGWTLEVHQVQAEMVPMADAPVMRACRDPRGEHYPGSASSHQERQQWQCGELQLC